MPIRALIFDVGGVLVHNRDGRRRLKWEQRFGLPEGALQRTVWSLPISLQATIGQATLDEVWADVAQRYDLTPDERSALIEDFWSGGEWDDDLIAYIRSLRKWYATGVLSNAWPGAREANREHLNDDAFDMLLFSAEEGLAKPEPEIYRRALSRLKVTPGQAIFVDDLLENVEAARSLGLQAIHFEERQQMLSELGNLLAGEKPG
jgi:epoxide hydrolase-like predicted phosphatase